jgi:DNA-binding response OmpR family regulator
MADLGQLRGQRILLVEDEYLVAEILCEFLEDVGATVLGPFGWCDEALAFISDHAVDMAVLDVNLHGQPSFPIADALIKRGIRFVFTTGYDSSVLKGTYSGYPRCEKPFSQKAICEALTSIVA